MNQFLGAIVLTVCIVFTFFFAVRYSVVHKYQVEATIDFDEKTRAAIFTQDPNKENKKLPFIVAAEVEEDSTDILTFNIVAYAPNDKDTIYVLTALPEKSDFQADERVLEPGMNVERVSVFFGPDNSFKRNVNTEFMTFYIHANGEDEYNKTYVRKANFVKSWRKIKHKGIFLKRSEYHTQ